MRPNTRLLMSCLAACVLVGSMLNPSLHGQNQPAASSQQPTFRSTTALVEVDAIILDKQDHFVPGLKAEDLEIFEDGKRQNIRQFYMVTHDLGTRKELANNDAVKDAEYSAHRVFVLLFDEGHLANDSMARVKRGAEEFVRDQMGPGDAGGIYVDGAMFRSLLTTDKQQLLAGVRAVKPAFDTRQGILAPFREWPRIDSEIDAYRITNGAREVTDQLGVKACQEEPQSCQAEGGLGEVENKIQQKARLYIRQAQMLTDQTIKNLQTVCHGLSRIPGRKTVVFMTEGFFVEDSRSILQKIAGEAARGGVTIYSIDGRGNINGLSANPDVTRRERGRSTLFDTGEDGPNILTSGTGGLMVRNIDDMSRAFGLIVRDTSTYYVIGYEPDNATMDGKFRKIEVKTKTSGLRVRARKGYSATVLPPQEVLWGPGK
jgi:VWFA-related protein